MLASIRRERAMSTRTLEGSMKYQLQYLRDPCRIVMHTDFSLARWSYIRSRGFNVPNDTECDPGLSDALLEIPGVVCVQVEPYQVEIIIGRLFHISDLLPEILEAIRVVAGPFATLEEVLPAIPVPSTIEVVCPHCGFHRTVEEPT
jgi:hypothetical protein